MGSMNRQGMARIPVIAALVVLHLALVHPLPARAYLVCVGAQSATLHEAPSVDSPQTGIAGKGERLEVLEKHEEWLRVQGSDNTVGWIEIGSIDETCGKGSMGEARTGEVPAGEVQPGGVRTGEGSTGEAPAGEGQPAGMRTGEGSTGEAPADEGQPAGMRTGEERTGEKRAMQPFTGEEKTSEGYTGEEGQEGKGGSPLNLKVTMTAVTIRRDPDSASPWIGSARKNEILTGIEERNGWFRCRTTDGKEGWISASSCVIVPLHAESARTELRRVLINCDKMAVRAGPGEDYPSLGVLSLDQEAGVYLEESEWIYIKNIGEQMEGWVQSTCVFDPERNQNLSAWKEEALTLSEKLTGYYDQKKKESGAYREAGWYPSFSLFSGEKDVTIEPLHDGWRLGLAFSTRRISLNTLFPLSEETVPLSLSKADRLFFLTLLQALMENEMYKEVTIHLRGLKRSGGRLTWVDAGGFTLKKSRIEGIDLDKLGPEEFWDLLDQS